MVECKYIMTCTDLPVRCMRSATAADFRKLNSHVTTHVTKRGWGSIEMTSIASLCEHSLTFLQATDLPMVPPLSESIYPMRFSG